MHGLEKLLESPYTALVVAVVFGALALGGRFALSGRFNVTATQILLIVAGAVAFVGLWTQPWPVMIGGGVIIGVVLLLLGYFFRPDAVPAYSGIFSPKVETILSAKRNAYARILEINASGVRLHWQGDPNDAMFRFFETSGLRLELVDGKLKVSTQIRNPDGDFIAELVRNELKVAVPPKTFDRNYTDDALEIKNAQGRIVLQVKVLPDAIQLQGEWWGTAGQGVRLVANPDRQQGGALMKVLSREQNPDNPRIEPMFEYPSDSHLGELKKRS